MRPPAVWKRPDYLPANTTLGDTRVIDRMLRFVTNRRTVVQAGAHVGLWPAVLSQYFQRVVSFEPMAKLHAVAVEAAPYPNVTICQWALTDRGRQLILSVPGTEKMERYSGSCTVVSEPCENAIEVPGCTLDSFAFPDVDAIMLDIEGHEMHALNGAVDTIERSHPVIVVEENEKSLRYRGAGAVDRFLEPFGYERVSHYEFDVIFKWVRG